MSQTTSTDSSVTEYVMNKKLGAIAMLLSATGMGLVGTHQPRYDCGSR